MRPDRPYRPTWERRVELLDRAFIHRDHEWEREVVERLRRGEAGPRSLSTDELVPSVGGASWAQAHGWEQIEEHAKDAIRTNAVFVSDSAIEGRREERERRKAAWAEFQVVWEAEREQRRQRAREVAAAAEARRQEQLAEAIRQWERKKAAEAAREAQEAEWRGIEREKRRLERKAALAASWAAKAEKEAEEARIRREDRQAEREQRDERAAAAQQQWDRQEAARGEWRKQRLKARESLRAVTRAARWAGRDAFFERRRGEIQRILDHKFECSSCGTLATISERVINAQEAISVYQLKCGCAERWWYHDDLLAMMA